MFRALRLRALQENPEAFGASYEETAAQPLVSIAQRLRPDPVAPHNVILGAFDDAPDSDVLSGIVGFRREQGAKRRHKGMIWGMYVARELQGRGIGRALLERTIAAAREQPSLEQINLAVVSTNTPALRLYRSLGFASYGVEPQALKLGDHDQYVDEDLMVLQFGR